MYPLPYVTNYGFYATFAKEQYQEVFINDVVNKANWYIHVKWIVNILLDGIEEEPIQAGKIRVYFDSQRIDYVDLSIFDYFENLVLWYLFISIGEQITPFHIYFEYKFITRENMKAYVDDKFIERYREYLGSLEMNKIIDDAMSKYQCIDEFKFYLCNTLNITDFTRMMREDPEVYDALHLNLEGVPIEDVKDEGMRYMKIVNDKIKESPYHCLRDSVGCGEAISDKQEKEVFINIGTKPNGEGGAYPIIINRSFVMGGVCDVASYYIDSSGGRIAQIINKTNVGTSGQFARLLSLNNRDTFLNPDPNYSCMSHNYQRVEVKNYAIFSKLATGRYYRFNPDGQEFKLTRKDTHVIGKTIYLRSPMTCASNSAGMGICYKCYGDLAYRNRDLNIGQLASELLSSALTQKLLSAKHLLESKIQKVVWCEDFFKFFDMNCNTIRIAEEFNPSKYKILINPDSIPADDLDDEFVYPTITSFEVYCEADGSLYEISNFSQVEVSILDPLIKYLNSPSYEKEYEFGTRITIPMDKVNNENIFAIDLVNDDLSKTLERCKALINKESETVNNDRHSILQKLLETCIDGKLKITSVHLEVILSNQLRDVGDDEASLCLPDWMVKDADYQIITLNKALTDNPSVTKSLEYQKIAKLFYYPLTYKKTAPSTCDLVMMENPQQYINNPDLISQEDVKDESPEGPEVLVQFEDGYKPDAEDELTVIE